MPRIEQRGEITYIGKRLIVPMQEIEHQIPALLTAVKMQLVHLSLLSAGRPIVRYWTIDMPSRMDIEVGIPIASNTGSIVERTSIPSGRYATLAYIGLQNGIESNKRLIEWIASQGETMDCRNTPEGQTFKARYETFLTDGNVQLDRLTWETEVAIKLCD